MGKYLKEHPELFDRHLRPLVVRILDAYDSYNRVPACNVLLAMGDRSDELMEILELAAVDGWGRREVPLLCETYGLTLDIPEGEATYEQYIAAWQRTHEIVIGLKKKYPLDRSSKIQHWDLFCHDDL